MSPFAEEQLTAEMRNVFNYRLSRARRIIENTFGIFFSRWKIFYKPIEGKPELVEKIVLAATALHSYLQQTHKRTAICRFRRKKWFIYRGSVEEEITFTEEILDGKLCALLEKP